MTITDIKGETHWCKFLLYSIQLVIITDDVITSLLVNYSQLQLAQTPR